ncbi:4'-phosphopantetheinyl transferase family protein [Novipirellula artificiosorum]|uniref:4'-phosphopantetheinyl transferase sfp n=1 Tax=Novipirellula artificiosorum TaxID=2528016 RepID=A0A5C6DZY6_9BACT|nr:4'-phosphopantetheinyl transferase superfamily protein [Novipirellula artificiosorum]TWU40459.1 4'-phosphopantetheinyl transferase sfp [Novipirellula artificiosorum]
MCQSSTEPFESIHVWHATSSHTEPGAVETYCERFLDPGEQDRANRFRVATSRNQHVIGRGMAKHLLAQAVMSEGIHPRSIRFSALPHGKPIVKTPPDLSLPFNVAHTNGLVLCGIGDRSLSLLGVDVEQLERQPDPELAIRYFSAPEVEYVYSFSCRDRRNEAFLRVWTLKEAFIKAIGTGLHTPLSDFAFENIDDPSPTIRMLSPTLPSAGTWKFFSFTPRDAYIGAIAVATVDDRPALSMELFDFDTVVRGVRSDVVP